VIQCSGQSNMQKVQCNVHKSQRKHSETAGKNSSDRLDPTQYIPWLENMTSKHYQINSLEDFYGIANFSHNVKFQNSAYGGAPLVSQHSRSQALVKEEG